MSELSTRIEELKRRVYDIHGASFDLPSKKREIEAIER